MNFLSGCEEFIQVYRGLLLTKVAWRSQVWRGLVGSSVFQLPHHYCLVVLYILAHKGIQCCCWVRERKIPSQTQIKTNSQVLMIYARVMYAVA